MIRNPLTLMIPLFALAAGCADNPVIPEEHFEARGVVLLRTGSGGIDTTIATVDGSQIAGQIDIDTLPGGHAITVRFIDEDGNVGLPSADPDAGWDHDLAITVADTTIARATDVQRWGFRLVGLRAGATTVSVHLLHGGHDDYVSLAIPVVVRP